MTPVLQVLLALLLLGSLIALGSLALPLLPWVAVATDVLAAPGSNLLLVVTIYTTVFIFGRMWFVALPARRLLSAQILSIRQRMDDKCPPGVSRLLDEAEQLIPTEGWGIVRALASWNGARELQGWRLVHEAERLAIQQWSAEAVYARMQRAKIEADALPGPDAAEWKAVFQRHLGDTPPPLAVAREELVQGLVVLHNRTDTSFATLLELQNKGTWLVVAGLLAAGLVAYMFGQSERLLLAGAVGGLLNRLRRVYTAGDIPTDYGASWVPLFLSPVVGALTGWSGVQLLLLGQQIGVFDLSVLALDNPQSTAVVGASLVMGFAEQWFDQVSKRVQEQTA